MADVSKDVPEYEALNLLNYGTEPDLVAAATAYAMAALPEWQPRAGNTEMVLIESLAVMLGPEIMAIQMLPGQIVEQLMKLYGVARSEGAPVIGRAKFTVTNSSPTQIIPAGTRLRLPIPGTGETVDFLTQDELQIITSEAATGEVNIYAEYLGPVGNATPNASPLEVVDTLPFVESVATVGALSGGAGPEPDYEFQGRASATLARLTSTLVLPESFQYAAASRPEVGRAKVFDLYNPAAPLVNPAVGYVTVALAGHNGEVLPGTVTADIANWLAGQALSSLKVTVIDPTYTTVNLTVSVKASVGFTVAQVQASVTAALADWLNAKTWDWNPVVGQFAIAAKVGAAAGVAEVTSVPANINLTGKAPLPILGTVTVNVV
ncbi:baseplate J-like protein [Arthrobacter phage vB_ArtM-ArV1]|uniref:Baseplate J-like protein n=1 Tax=Arthrobacter phage vB_ArtM-ArV1 TaxID=1566993 RepID=A0A0A7HBT3_9CAUD|nr:baseplate J-like protein [Arthrobacter phage vB_ArtM-ArV1]AIZ01721.1 baseplate J-like protein [Arthrobacter phage vB_ArtM-ArV1]